MLMVMKKILVLFILAVAAVRSHGLPPLGTDASPTSFPVQLFFHDGTSTNASGSGLYFLRGTNAYLATAKHLLINPQDRFPAFELTCISYPYGREDTNCIEVEINLRELGLRGNVLFATNGHDVAALRIASIKHSISNEGYFTFDFVSGVKALRQSSTGPLFLREVWSLMFSDLEAGTPVFVFGFPSSLSISRTHQFDSRRPLLRSGVIAGTFPARKTFVVDAAVYPGNSGGPVVAVVDDPPFARRIHLVGIVSEYIPAVEVWKNDRFQFPNFSVSNSGYTVVEPIDSLFEITQ